MQATQGCFVAYYQEPGEIDGLFRCGSRVGEVFQYAGHIFVKGSVGFDEYVGTSKISLALALSQFLKIRRILG
jgi:hypothetical protein